MYCLKQLAAGKFASYYSYNYVILCILLTESQVLHCDLSNHGYALTVPLQ